MRVSDWYTPAITANSLREVALWFQEKKVRGTEELIHPMQE